MKNLNLNTINPVLSWAPNELSKDEIQLVRNTANMPVVFKHLALMPDAHLGYGAMVGSVLATKEAIIPSAVGVDIGCGMMARKTPFKSNILDGKLPLLRSEIEKAIPIGFHDNSIIDEISKDWISQMSPLSQKVKNLIGEKDIDKALKQLGSLGGGNHFIEINIDTEDNVWLMLHSGSRNAGKVIADIHINEAKGLMKDMNLNIPNPDLAFLVEGTDEFKDYWNDLLWAQQYAMKNREIMMDRLILIFQKTFNENKPFDILMSVNCHHNYAQKENHFGQDVYVTRKGAVRARKNDLGIIPGSMGSRSFIVKGKGNELSFNSCSHGAGRAMSRNKAREVFSLKDLEEQTMGIECRKDEGILDEIPKAYKDIDVVMNSQRDLVEVVAELHQILCVKG